MSLGRGVLTVRQEPTKPAQPPRASTALPGRSHKIGTTPNAQPTSLGVYGIKGRFDVGDAYQTGIYVDASTYLSEWGKYLYTVFTTSAPNDPPSTLPTPAYPPSPPTLWAEALGQLSGVKFAVGTVVGSTIIRVINPNVMALFAKPFNPFAGPIPRVRTLFGYGAIVALGGLAFSAIEFDGLVPYPNMGLVAALTRATVDSLLKLVEIISPGAAAKFRYFFDTMYALPGIMGQAARDAANALAAGIAAALGTLGAAKEQAVKIANYIYYALLAIAGAYVVDKGRKLLR